MVYDTKSLFTKERNYDASITCHTNCQRNYSLTINNMVTILMNFFLCAPDVEYELKKYLKFECSKSWPRQIDAAISGSAGVETASIINQW